MNNYQNPQNEDKYRPSFFQRNSGRVKIVATICVCIATLLIIIGACIGCYYAGKKSSYINNINSELPIANEVYTLIKKYYYKDITKEDFEQWASIGLTQTMDQFSGISYSSTLPTLAFGFSFKTDSYSNHIVTEVSDNSPAEKAGLTRGDLLIAVNGESVVGLNRDVLSGEKFLGNPSSIAEVTVKKSDGTEKELIMRKSIVQGSEAHYINFGNGIGYIKLDSFTGTADKDFVNCANAFKQNGNTKLILDLRDNGGGSTDILSLIASYLVHDDNDKSNGLGIIQLDSAKTNETITYSATGDNWLGKGMNGAFKLAVLVNENSASASEALLGAIKFYCGNEVSKYKNELVVIGTPTYGKGIAQQTFQLSTTPSFLLSMTVGYFKVPIMNNGKQGWKSYHGEPMDVSEGYKINKFTSEIDYTKNNLYLEYYNNDLMQEKAIIKALEALA